MAWADELRRASFRGVPFGVLEAEKSVGRRIALHEYPYRDDPWAEDLGRNTQRHRIRGFLVENDRYGGGDVISQRQAMEAAAQLQGQAVLVHPTLGTLQVTLFDLNIVERWDAGRCFELQFNLIEGGGQSLTSILASFASALGLSAVAADITAASDFVNTVTSEIQTGISTVQSIESSAFAFGGDITSLTYDATNLFGSLALLQGNNGRYASGGTTGYLQQQPTPAASVATLITTAATNRATVASAEALVQQTINGLGSTYEPVDVASAIQAHVAALAAACPSPAIRIGLLARLASYTPTAIASASPAGVATTALYRRSAVTQLAQAGLTYSPSSYGDALSVRATITGPIDAEIDTAGDTGADDVFAAFRTLRANVVLDLQQRGAALPPLKTVTTAVSFPDEVLAMRLYGDPSRADGLVLQANPPNPLFMPTSFLALAS